VDNLNAFVGLRAAGHPAGAPAPALSKGAGPKPSGGRRLPARVARSGVSRSGSLATLGK
jgi:hypothetical protein